MKKSFKKTISYLLILCLLMQTCFAGFAFAGTASVLQQIEIDGTVIDVNQDLRENADGTYTLSVELSSEINRVAKSEDNTVSKNEYFTVKKSGTYVIELWGGDGASGTTTNYSAGGTGGAGGYIYATVELKQGETLFYTLGGDGEPTNNEDLGGGINGTGGGHGNLGGYSVGGGGGYSAVFKFEAGEFDKYLDASGKMNVETISEEDRLSKYIMIAAGGGGGGAGNGFSFYDPVGTADGGAGGNLNSNKGVLSGEEYQVEGTYFEGQDGKSSGTSSAYIGHGGTFEPGVVADTITTIFDGKQPNDWEGTYNAEYKGGAGGSGNFRGGAGGAGYCGGSGGIMTSLIEATNIGGGGGGSSFIATGADYVLDDNEKGFLIGTNDSKEGGMVNIAYVASVDEIEEIGKDLSFSATISKYFDYVNSEGLKDSATINSDGTTSLNIEDIKLELVGTTVKKTIDITLKPKNGFAGGNNVPLFAPGSQWTFESGLQSDTVNVDNIKEGTHVNVPLDFDIITNSYSFNEAQTEFAVEDLYKDYKGTHTSLLASYEDDFKYDFVDTISNIVVKDSKSNVVSGNISIDKTTRFDVSYTVKLTNNGVASVGNENPLENVISKEAVVSVLESGTTTLNGVEIKYNKTLTYTDNKYNLSLNLKGSASDSTTIIPKPEPQKIAYDSSSSNNTYEYKVEKDGYYLIQAWGGNGGKGLGETWDRIFSEDVYRDGGNGGAGGYNSGYLKLSKDDILYISLGRNGDSATSDSIGGTGGNYTSVTYNNTSSYLIISGGGGGGGNASCCELHQRTGKDGDASTLTSNDLSQLSETYNGASGEPGDDGLFGDAGKGGAAGRNYVSTDVTTTSSEYDLGKSTDYTNNGGGAVYITCLKLDNNSNDETVKSGLEAKLSNYLFNAEISKYFNIDKENISIKNSDDSNASFINSTSGSKIALSTINPKLSDAFITNADGTKTYTYSFDYTVNIPLTPKEGFLGGNDVPVLLYSENSGTYETGMQIGQGTESSSIHKVNETDFANVAIPFTINNSDLTTHDHIYVLGTEGIDKTDLYDLSNSVKTILNKTYAWEDDYVNINIPGEDLDAKLTPSTTTSYDLKARIQPKKSASQAVVIDSVEGSSVTKQATIYVKYKADYNLTNLTTSAVPTKINDNEYYLVEQSEDYVVTLSPEPGYLLPDKSAVKVTKDDLTTPIDFTYNSETGELIIPKNQLTGNIVIEATAKLKTYKLSFIYESWVDGKMETHTKVYEYPAGATIVDFTSTHNPNPCPPGHTFVWDWETDNKEPLTTMPARDHIVVGKYVPIECTVKVNYVYKAGVTSTEPLPEAYQETLTYGKEYNVVSPQIPGYIPNMPVVSGTVSEEVINITVEYSPAPNGLTIFYIQSDTGKECFTKVEQDVNTGEAYNVASPALPGYTPSKLLVSGTMTAGGIVEYVYYKPNVYTITFDDEGGNLSETEKLRKVVYNNIYGYVFSEKDGNETLTYVAFPEPTKLGYKFGGWYTEPNGQGTLIAEDSKVNITKEQTLYAHWIENKYTVTIRYQYEDGTKAFDDYNKEFKVGDDYSVDSPVLTGHTASKSNVSGKIGTKNVLEIVTYVANAHTLTINYKKSGESDPFETYVATVKYGEEYSVDSPELSGFTASSTTVIGIMPDDNRTLTVIYYKDLPEVAVTVTWGDLSFNYNRGDWNTETLTYGPDSIEPVIVDGKPNNTIKVRNSATSEVSVEADITYESYNKYSTLVGYFTPDADKDTNQSEKVYITAPIEQGKEKTIYFWLKGTLNNKYEGTITSGVCNITIRPHSE